MLPGHGTSMFSGNSTLRKSKTEADNLEVNSLPSVKPAQLLEGVLAHHAPPGGDLLSGPSR